MDSVAGDAPSSPVPISSNTRAAKGKAKAVSDVLMERSPSLVPSADEICVRRIVKGTTKGAKKGTKKGTKHACDSSKIMVPIDLEARTELHDESVANSVLHMFTEDPSETLPAFSEADFSKWASALATAVVSSLSDFLIYIFG